LSISLDLFSNIYFCSCNSVIKISRSGEITNITIVSETIQGPKSFDNGLIVDDSGNIFMTNTVCNTVVKVNSTGNNITTYGKTVTECSLTFVNGLQDALSAVSQAAISRTEGALYVINDRYVKRIQGVTEKKLTTKIETDYQKIAVTESKIFSPTIAINISGTHFNLSTHTLSCRLDETKFQNFYEMSEDLNALCK